MRRTTDVIRILLLLVFTGSAAQAGGLYIREIGHPLQGASSAGDGAIVQDASTAVTNPAGTAQLEGSEWMVAGIGIYSTVEFEQQPGTTVVGSNGGDAGGFAPGASLFYARPFGEQFGFGFGFNALSGAVLEHDAGWVGRYWVEEVELLVVAAAPSIAWQINDQWSVSFGVPVAVGTLDLDVAIPSLTGAGADGRARIKDGTDFVATLSASVLWELTERFRVGLVYSGELDFDFDSDLEITLPVGGGTALPQVSANVAIPLVQTLRLSAASDIGDKLTVLATVGWEDWSAFESVFIRTANVGGELPRDWDDTWTFALGLRWRTGGPWTYHTGLAYDTDPTDASKRTADMPIDRQIRLSGGATYEFQSGRRLGGVLTYADYGDAAINNGGDWGQVVGDYKSNSLLFMGINFAW